MEGGKNALTKQIFTVKDFGKQVDDVLDIIEQFEPEFLLKDLGERRLYMIYQKVNHLLVQLRYSLTDTDSYAPYFDWGDKQKEQLKIPVKIKVDSNQSLIIETVPLFRRGSKKAFHMHCSIEEKLTRYMLSVREKPLIEFPMSILFIRCLKQFSMRTPDSDNIEVHKLTSRICAALCIPESKGQVNFIYSASIVGEDYTRIIVAPSKNIGLYL